jgi:hypothetical protein
MVAIVKDINKITKKTMHEVYGEPNDEAGKHICCDKCGGCKTCGCFCDEEKKKYIEKVFKHQNINKEVENGKKS